MVKLDQEGARNHGRATGRSKKAAGTHGQSISWSRSRKSEKQLRTRRARPRTGSVRCLFSASKYFLVSSRCAHGVPRRLEKDEKIQLADESRPVS